MKTSFTYSQLSTKIFGFLCCVCLFASCGQPTESATNQPSAAETTSTSTTTPKGEETQNDSTSFDYFLNLMAEQKEIPFYLIENFFADSISNAFKEEKEKIGFASMQGNSVSTHKNIKIVTFETRIGVPCTISNIASFDLEGTMIDYHEFYSCDCNEPFCSGESFTLEGTVIKVKTEIWGGDSSSEEERAKDTTYVTDYVISDDGTFGI
ncbi:MAG: hypothetical protein MK212_00440 [Saprospiraceae bacterium]|nr:hypothetical protein [Saprospiraceae bacterium]